MDFFRPPPRPPRERRPNGGLGRIDRSFSRADIGRHCTRGTDTRSLDLGPSQGPDRAIRAQEDQVDGHLDLDGGIAPLWIAPTRQERGAVSGGVLRGGFLRGLPGRTSDLLGSGQRGGVGRRLGPGPSLENAEEIHRDDDQDPAQEQDRGGDDGDRSPFTPAPVAPGHPVS